MKKLFFSLIFSVAVFLGMGISVFAEEDNEWTEFEFTEDISFEVNEVWDYEGGYDETNFYPEDGVNISLIDFGSYKDIFGEEDPELINEEIYDLIDDYDLDADILGDTDELEHKDYMDLIGNMLTFSIIGEMPEDEFELKDVAPDFTINDFNGKSIHFVGEDEGFGVISVLWNQERFLGVMYLESEACEKSYLYDYYRLLMSIRQNTEESVSSAYVGVWQGTDQNQTTIVLHNDGTLFYTELGSTIGETVQGINGTWAYDETTGKITMDLVNEYSYAEYVLSGIPENGSMVLKCENGQPWNEEVINLTDLTEAWVRVSVDRISGKYDYNSPYEAYAAVVKDYESYYGNTKKAFLSDQSEGLCYYELVDFDNDGREEFLLYYKTTDDYYGNTICRCEVWKYGEYVKHSVAEIIYSEMAYCSEGLYYMLRAENSGCSYLVMDEGGSIDSVRYYYGFLTDGSFGIVNGLQENLNDYRFLCLHGPEADPDEILNVVNETRAKLSLPAIR